MPIDDFALSNLGGFTLNPAGSIVMDGEEIKAATGGVMGRAYMAHGDPETPVRLAFTIVPDTSDVAGRMMGVGQQGNSAAAGKNGLGIFVGYVAGRGFVVSFLADESIVSPSTILPDAEIVSGDRYHVEVLMAPESQAVLNEVFVQVWKYGNHKDMLFVGFGERATGFSSWYTWNYFQIVGNSDAASVSRLAFTNGLYPTSTTGAWHLGNTAAQMHLPGAVNPDKDWFELYLPGGEIDPSKVDAVVIRLHGIGGGFFGEASGSNNNSADRALDPQFQSVAAQALSQGMHVYHCNGYSANAAAGPYEDSSNYGNDEALASQVTLIEHLVDLHGPGLRIILSAFSHGGNMAGRLVNHPVVSRFIKAVWLTNAQTSTLNEWLFDPSASRRRINAAYGLPEGATEAEARAVLEPIDTHRLIDADQGRAWDGKTIFITTNENDGSVLPSYHAAELSAKMERYGVPHVYIRRNHGGHVTPLKGYEADASRFWSEYRRDRAAEAGPVRTRLRRFRARL